MFRSEYLGEEITTNTTWASGQWNHETEYIPNAITNSHISKRAVIIGNGESRRNYELFLLKNHRAGILGSLAVQTYGCNALYRDFKPTFLIATGPDIAKEIAGSDYYTDNIVYANAEVVARHPGKFYLIPQDVHYDAGALAVYLACFDGHKTIYLVGFDSTGVGAGNDMYDGTNAYAPYGTDHSDTMWVKTLSMVMETYPDVQFVRVMPTPGWKIPDAWQTFSNFKQISYKQFVLDVDL